MDIRPMVRDLDSLITEGKMIEGINRFFAANAATKDYLGVRTVDKAQALEKMQAIQDAIFKINAIRHHATLVDGNKSASEFTFDFDLRGNTSIYWHEVIRRVWNDEGKVVKEEYFNSHNLK